MAANAIDLSAIRPDVLYPNDQAAAIRGKSAKTLANERCQGIGPAVHYVGKRPMYLGKDLIDDLQRNRVDFRQPALAPRRRVQRAVR